MISFHTLQLSIYLCPKHHTTHMLQVIQLAKIHDTNIKPPTYFPMLNSMSPIHTCTLQAYILEELD